MIMSRRVGDGFHYHLGKVVGHATLPLSFVTPLAAHTMLIHPDPHL